MTRRFWVGTAMVTAVLAGALATQTAAQVKVGKTRPLTTKHLMSGLVKPQWTLLGESLKDNGPADDKGWDAVATQAELLNESAHIMMADGRCPDAVWAGACKSLQDGTQALLAKVAGRDAAGAREALGQAGAACGACHKAHKK
jgi:cytochrome c556